MRFISVTILAAVLLLACGRPQNNQSYETFPYTSFRDVPGITESEIRAIEALQKQKSSFVYAMTAGTESFSTDGVTIRGFSALICEWLTGLFGIPFIPAVYEWSDLIAGLKTGEIDFSGDLTPSEERRKIYFMTGDIAQRTLKYYRVRGNPPLLEIAATRPLRLAFLEGSTVYDQIAASKMYEPFEKVAINSYGYAYELLKTGKADAFFAENVVEYMLDMYDDVIAESFFPMLFSPVSLTTQNKTLAPIISVVQKILHSGGPYYLSQLYKQGYREYLEYKLFTQLTEKEKEYIQKHPVVSFAAENDNYPVCFYNTRERQWQGIVFDLLDEIQTLTGMTFKVVNDQYTDEPFLVEMLESGEASMITELIYSEERKGRFLWPKTAVMTDFYALLSKSEFRNININDILYVRVGLPKGTAHTALFKNWFPDHEHCVEYENMNAAFDALARGEVDMVMSSQHQFLTLTNFRELAGYKVNMAFDRTFDSTFGFNKNEQVLCSIVDKALALIDTKGVSGQWMRKTFDYRIKLMKERTSWLVGAIMLFMGLLFLLFLFQRKRSEGRKLEHQVMERTAELLWSQRDLEMALKSAEAANLAKSVFLANMSHEIRTPMNSILGFSELALDNEISPKTRDYLSKIHTNTEWLIQIINDILDISKIESGKMELEAKPFDLQELFNNCRTLILPKAAEKGIGLFFHVDPDIDRMLLGDPTRLRQILGNLLSNAVKFTNTGVVKLQAAIKSKNEKNIAIRFEVKDSGIGMTPEQIEKMFELFTQAETGTTRQYGGMGLGLSIAKNLIELMGGKLSVESMPDVGSKFSFSIVFNVVDTSDEEIFGKKILHSKIEKPVFQGEILLCEDNVMNQQVICEHLARVGLKTVVADNGKIGVEIVQSRKEKNEKQFDLIFMDIHMPVMDGIETAARIMAIEPEIPIVAMTANVMASDREVYIENGMLDCVGKPFTSQELWRCLMKYLMPISGGTELKNTPEKTVLQKTKPQKAVPQKAPRPEPAFQETAFQETALQEAALQEAVLQEAALSETALEEDLEFQKKLQILFAKNNRTKFEEIIKALKADDIKLAHRLTHSLKSNAGQIGKQQLRQAAADVEYLLKDGEKPATEERLKILETELNTVLTELLPLLNEASAPATLAAEAAEQAAEMGTLDTAARQELFEKLEPLLEMGSPQSREFIWMLRRVPGCETLIQQIENFDFEMAVATFADLKKNA